MELRIGDAERERALTALGEHFAQGRLAREEYDERADAVWTARTAGDLRPLFVDLPQGSPVVDRPAPPPPRRRARTAFDGLPGPLKVLVALVLAALVLTHLPMLLVAGVVWFVLSRQCGVARPPWAPDDRHRNRQRHARGW